MVIIMSTLNDVIPDGLWWNCNTSVDNCRTFY